MTRHSAVRGWAAVHGTRPALGLLSVVAVLSWWFGQVSISRWGLIGLPGPVSVLLLLPLVAGVAVAVGCENSAKLPLPNPPRAALARLAWLTAWTGLAVAAANAGQLAGAAADPVAVSRNVLFHAALALTACAFGATQLAWLPSLAFTVVCMLFGYPPYEQRYYWWAVIMPEEVGTGQLAAVVLLYGLAALRQVTGATYGRRW